MKFIILLIVYNFSKLNAQHNMPTIDSIIDRYPAMSGQFYNDNKQLLDNDLQYYFSVAVPHILANVVAIVSPHAAYEYSGRVAASAFNQIDTTKKYEHIFVIGSSHHVFFDGASIYHTGNYIITGDTITVDTDFAKDLIQRYEIFQFGNQGHDIEHSIEVQLPMLNYVMRNKKYKIVPILIGTDKVSTCKTIAEILLPYFNENNLFIFSTDFSHYPKASDAQSIDAETLNAICSNSSENLATILSQHQKSNIKNLETSLCGWSSIFTLMYMTENIHNIKFKPIFYQNSGDVSFEKNKQNVVGYHAIGVTMED